MKRLKKSILKNSRTVKNPKKIFGKSGEETDPIPAKIKYKDVTPELEKKLKKSESKQKAPAASKPKKKNIFPDKKIPLAILNNTRVEYFDDRFYKALLPLNTHKDYIQNIPENYIYRSPDGIEVYLPSVSTILGKVMNKEFLARWRGDVGNERADKIIDAALNKGSNIHNAIDLLCNGTIIIYQNLKSSNISTKEIKAFQRKVKRPVMILHDQAEMIQVTRFKRLIDMIGPEIVSTEQNVFSLDRAYAGTLDQVWNIQEGTHLINTGKIKTFIPGGLYIIDFKTGKGYDEFSTYLQMAAYYKAHHLNDVIIGALGIHLNSDTKSGIEGVKVYQLNKDQLDNYYEQFTTYQRIFNYDVDLIPKRYDFPAIIQMDKKNILKIKNKKSK